LTLCCAQYKYDLYICMHGSEIQGPGQSCQDTAALQYLNCVALPWSLKGFVQVRPNPPNSFVFQVRNDASVPVAGSLTLLNGTDNGADRLASVRVSRNGEVIFDWGEINRDVEWIEKEITLVPGINNLSVEVGLPDEGVLSIFLWQ